MTDTNGVKPRRILIFSLSYFPHLVAGAEVAVKETTDRISPDEFKFDLITVRTEANPVIHIGNVKVHGVGSRVSRPGIVSKFLFPVRALFKALSLHRKHKYDAVWPIMASYAGFAALLFKKFHPRVPMVLTIQEGENFEVRDGIFDPFFKSIFKSADSIHSISNFLKSWSIAKGATCPITVIPNGVDISSFAREISVAESSELKGHIHKKEGDIILITTGRLVEKNGVGNLIDSLAFLQSNVKLIILGKGILEEKLKQQVSDLKLQDRVKFLGFVPHKNLSAYLQVSDIFIRPSLSEGLGNSFLEAMAAGIPVIATPVGGIPDFLVEGQTGLFCEVDNPQSIAQKVEKLLKDKESRDFIVRNARQMVEERYGWDGIAERIKKVFQETLSK